MLRNHPTRSATGTRRAFLNEVLSLNAQEFTQSEADARYVELLNEVLSLNAQESFTCPDPFRYGALPQ